jgi:Cytochrome C oxidase, cbb3-type, subunit III
MLRAFLAALVLIAPCWVAQAQYSPCYNRQTYSYPTVVKKEVVYENQVLVAQFVPLVVTVPTYSATYAAGYLPTPSYTPAAAVAQPNQPAPAAQGFNASALEQQIQILVQKVTNLETQIQGGTVTAQNTQGNDFVRLFSTKCASCHDQAVAQSKGKGFVLLSGGKLVNLTPDQVLNVCTQCYGGDMPKGGKLTDQEVGLIMAWGKAMKGK